MTTPTGEQVTASIQALRTDAARWTELCGELRTVAGTAAGLGLSSFHFSGLGHLLGIDSLYTEIQQRIVTLLNQGADNFDNIGGALRTAADGYEQDEQNAVHRMRNIY